LVDCTDLPGMTEPPVSIERSETVVICTLEDPEERNALTAEAATHLIDALDGVEDTGARCVLLRGAGDTFCAAGDVGAHVDRVDGTITESEWTDRMDATADAVAAVYNCPVPTVAAVDGPAFSEGACLALACDLRLASTTGSIGFGFRRFGQAAGTGATYLLPRLVGPDIALELLYTGDLIDARRATELGLFTRCYPEAAFEDELAGVLASLSTGPADAMLATKRLSRTDHDSLSAAIDAEREVQTALAETSDFEEGVTAFVQQRDPQF
jgi:enoyl-CoA hydratase/carnithine racemase